MLTEAGERDLHADYGPWATRDEGDAQQMLRGFWEFDVLFNPGDRGRWVNPAVAVDGDATGSGHLDR